MCEDDLIAKIEENDQVLAPALQEHVVATAEARIKADEQGCLSVELLSNGVETSKVLHQELSSCCFVEECFHPVIDLVGLAMSLLGELWADEIELELKLRVEVSQLLEVIGRTEEALFRLCRPTHHHYSDLWVLPEAYHFDQIDKSHREC